MDVSLITYLSYDTLITPFSLDINMAGLISLPLTSSLLNNSGFLVLKRILILNRPKALNAINLENVRKIYKQFIECEKTKSLMITKGSGDKAFCASGDKTTNVKVWPMEESKTFYEEYTTNALIKYLTLLYYKIPYIAERRLDIVIGLIFTCWTYLESKGKSNYFVSGTFERESGDCKNRNEQFRMMATIEKIESRWSPHVQNSTHSKMLNYCKSFENFHLDTQGIYKQTPSCNGENLANLLFRESYQQKPSIMQSSTTIHHTYSKHNLFLQHQQQAALRYIATKRNFESSRSPNATDRFIKSAGSERRNVISNQNGQRKATISGKMRDEWRRSCRHSDADSRGNIKEGEPRRRRPHSPIRPPLTECDFRHASAAAQAMAGRGKKRLRPDAGVDAEQTDAARLVIMSGRGKKRLRPDASVRAEETVANQPIL
uniref:3-hydroxyisobutyryl-CoA hydrolase, mitochondrial n=1 Tax=Glossina palpalis gambiensis TaxID=67801 RepID=A0A1B0ATS9_9MUSC